jgi:hypothetical protein
LSVSVRVSTFVSFNVKRFRKSQVPKDDTDPTPLPFADTSFHTDNHTDTLELILLLIINV